MYLFFCDSVEIQISLYYNVCRSITLRKIQGEIFSFTSNIQAREYNKTDRSNVVLDFFFFLPFALFVECLLLWFSLKSLTSHTWSKGDLSRSLLAPAKLWSVWPETRKKFVRVKQMQAIFRQQIFVPFIIFCWHFKNSLAMFSIYNPHKWHILVTGRKN